MAPLSDRMPKLSNKQYFDLLRVHEENLAALRDSPNKPAEYEQEIYEKMCKAMQQRFGVKLSPIGMRSHVWRLKERVERKVNAAACKSGSTDEDVLLRTAGFTPVEAHLYKLLTDKVLPLVIKDQKEHREPHSRTRAAHADEPQTSATPSPAKTTKKIPKKAAAAAPPPPPPSNSNAQDPDEPPKKKPRSHKKKPPAIAPPTEEGVQHSEPESTNVDAYMDTIERVAKMGRTAPGSYDEHLLDIRLPSLYVEEAPDVKKRKTPAKKKKAAEEAAASEAATGAQSPVRSPKPKANGKAAPVSPPVDRDQFLLNLKLDPAAMRLSTDDITNFKNNVQPGHELQHEKQLLCRTQRLLAAQRIALQTRQAEMLQSQTKFYDAWGGLAATFGSFFRFLPQPPPLPTAPLKSPGGGGRKPRSAAQKNANQAPQAATVNAA
ncbi:hypothetical protein M3Y99_00989300 [Aphelenchoides fujianensis]|nr:hypothetical protein M3Y99_00989300 [Aphelenchoides fujianensis]